MRLRSFSGKDVAVKGVIGYSVVPVECIGAVIGQMNTPTTGHIHVGIIHCLDLGIAQV